MFSKIALHQISRWDLAVPVRERSNLLAGVLLHHLRSACLHISLFHNSKKIRHTFLQICILLTRDSAHNS